LQKNISKFGSAWGLLLGVLFWALPCGAQEPLRYDLSRAPFSYDVEIVQSGEISLPAGERSQVRTSIKAKMQWTVGSVRTDGSRVVQFRFSGFDTMVTTRDGKPERYEYLDALAPFDVVVVMTPRGEVRLVEREVSNPARQRVLAMFQDLVVGGFPVLSPEPVIPGATWETQTSKNVSDAEVEARVVRRRVFRLESAGVVGFSSTATLDSIVTVDGRKIDRRTRIVGEGSTRFDSGVIVEQTCSWTASTPGSGLIGAVKLRTTVRVRRDR
jgi:hypothetical protein